LGFLNSFCDHIFPLSYFGFFYFLFDLIRQDRAVAELGKNLTTAATGRNADRHIEGTDLQRAHPV
jgi:hypothetical protein